MASVPLLPTSSAAYPIALLPQPPVSGTGGTPSLYQLIGGNTPQVGVSSAYAIGLLSPSYQPLGDVWIYVDGSVSSLTQIIQINPAPSITKNTVYLAQTAGTIAYQSGFGQMMLVLTLSDLLGRYYSDAYLGSENYGGYTSNRVIAVQSETMWDVRLSNGTYIYYAGGATLLSPVNPYTGAGKGFEAAANTGYEWAAVLAAIAQQYALAAPGIALALAQAYAAGYANILISAYNTETQVLIATYNGQANTANSNPAVIDPVGYATTAASAYVATANAAVLGAQTVAGGLVTQAQGIVTTTQTGTVNPAVTSAQTTLANEQAYIAAMAASATTTINTQIAAAQAIINTQVDTVNTLVATYSGTATTTEAAAYQSALTTIATEQATISALVAGIVATANATAAQAILLATTTIANAQAQLADRPLYYGALNTPITITSTTDVVVIPAGGLTIRAD